jgi:hypothetical protein
VIPASFSLQVYRGDSFSWEFVLWHDADRTQPVNLTGVTPKAEIRDRHGGTLMLELPLTVTLPNVIEADLSPDDSQKLTRHKGVWDLQLTLPDDTVATVIAGHVFIKPSVTDSA